MVTGTAALTLALLATPIANAYGEPDLVWPLRAIAAAMFGQSCLIMLTTVGSSLGRTVEKISGMPFVGRAASVMRVEGMAGD